LRLVVLLALGCFCRRLFVLLRALASVGSRFLETCLLLGPLAMPLSGAGLTFFAAAKKVTKESSLSG
jgi:hypothetical protein